MDRRDRYEQTNRWIDGKDKNRIIDGQTGQIKINKKMDRRERYKQNNRWIDGTDINRQIDGQTGQI